MAPLFGRKQRFVVTNIFVALDADAFAPILEVCAGAERNIVEHDVDFEIASEEIAHVAGTLLDKRAHWTHAAQFGEVFDDEGHADAYAQESFADLSARYLSEQADGAPTETMPGERRAVVILTIAYDGEVGALEREVGGIVELEDSLRAVRQLHHQGRLLVAHLHHAPSHPEDKLTDEQLLVNFPELMSL